MFKLGLSIFLIIGSVLYLTGCGGDSGESSTDLPEIIAPELPAWIDSGFLGNSILMVSENPDSGYQELLKYDDNSAVSSITPAMVVGGKIARIEISPDRKKIAYLADQLTDNRYELFVSNTDGTFNRRVSDAISRGHITDFEWSADSSSIIYQHQLSESSTDTANYYLTKFDEDKTQQITYIDNNGFGFKVESAHFVNVGLQYGMVVSFNSQKRLIVADTETSVEVRNIIATGVTTDGDWSLDGQYYAYITEILDDEQINTLDTFSGNNNLIHKAGSVGLQWSPLTNELAFFDFINLFVYDAVLEVKTTVSDFGGISPSSLSLKQFWDETGEYLILSASPRFEKTDLVVANTDGSGTLLLSNVLAVDEDISLHAVSSDARVAAVTESGKLYLANLDGSAIEDFSSVKIADGRIREIAWTADEKSLVTQYSASLSSQAVSRVETASRKVSEISGNNDIKCFLVANSSKSNCRLFFDTR